MLAVERGQKALEHLRRELVVDRDVAIVILLENAGDARRERALLRRRGRAPLRAAARWRPARRWSRRRPAPAAPGRSVRMAQGACAGDEACATCCVRDLATARLPSSLTALQTRWQSRCDSTGRPVPKSEKWHASDGGIDRHHHGFGGRLDGLTDHERGCVLAAAGVFGPAGARAPAAAQGPVWSWSLAGVGGASFIGELRHRRWRYATESCWRRC